MDAHRLESIRRRAEEVLALIDEIERLQEENELRKKVMIEHGCPLNIDLDE